MQGERECNAVLDDLKQLKSERLKLLAELRRVINSEKELMSLFWSPPKTPSSEPMKVDDDDVQLLVAEHGGDDIAAHDSSLEYVSLNSEEERKVRFEAERQSEVRLLFESAQENQQKDRPEQPETQATEAVAASTQTIDPTSPATAPPSPRTCACA